MTRENTELAGAIERLEADITANHAMTLGGAVVKVSDIRLILSALSAAPLHEGEGKPRVGEVRVMENGNVCRFIERELEGDKWEVLGALYTGPATHPEPVAWTSQDIIDALNDGAYAEGWFWPTFDECHPMPLFAAPPPSVEVERLREALALARTELGLIAMHKGLSFPASSEVLAGMAERSLSTLDAALSRKQEPGVPTPGDWVEWSGGENPVPGRYVDLRFRNGVVGEREWSDDQQGADDLPGAGWLHSGASYDIIAYRIVPTPGGEGE